VTIDIDVLDPGTAPGTGYPEPGGISYYQLKEALLLIAERYDVLGFDVTEVDPIYGRRRALRCGRRRSWCSICWVRSSRPALRGVPHQYRR